MADIQQHLASSHKVEFEDLDWSLARRSGLSAREAEMLQYFADIESQTVFYMLEVAKEWNAFLATEFLVVGAIEFRRDLLGDQSVLSRQNSIL